MAAAGGAERSPRRPRGAVQPPDPSARIRSPCWDLQLLYTAEGAHRGVARAAEGPSRGRALPASPRRRYRRRMPGLSRRRRQQRKEALQ
jgi:hypothetical protein